MKNKQTKTPVRLYKLVTAFTLLAYITNTIQSAYLLFAVYGTQVRPSQFTYVMILGALLPLLFFAITWWVVRGEKWYRLYVTSIVTTGVLAVSWALKSVSYFFTPYLWMPTNFELWVVVMEIIPLFIAAVVFVGVLRLLRKSPPKESKERMIRIFFVSSVAILVAANVVQEMYFIFQQYPNNQNLSGFFGSFITIIMMAVFFIPLYLREKNRNKVDRIFASALVVTMMVFLVSIASSVSMLLPDILSNLHAAIVTLLYTFGILGGIFAYIYLCRLIRRLP